MTTFNTDTFIKSLKERYGEIPFPEGDNSAKMMVRDAIKDNGYNPEDVLAYLYGATMLPSTLSDSDWETLVKDAIKRDDLVANHLKVYEMALKGKLSNEEMFNLAAETCGRTPVYLMHELRIDQYGWMKVIKGLVGTEVKESATEKTPRTKAELAAQKLAEKNAIKTPGGRKDSISIRLLNKKTGEVKVWDSYKACERDIFNDPKKGHGTVSQLVKGKLRSIKGIWVLSKEEEPKPTIEDIPVKRSRKRAINQVVFYLDGSTKVVNTFSSVEEASKKTGIPYSSISKAANGTYVRAGGFKWSYAEAV